MIYPCIKLFEVWKHFHVSCVFDLFPLCFSLFWEGKKRGTRTSSQVKRGCSLHRISSFCEDYLPSMFFLWFGNAVVFVLWETTVRYRWIMRESTLKDCFAGAVFVDTLAGKLDMWLCMTEPVQVNLSNMEFVGSICFLLLSAPSVCAVWFLSLSLSVPPFLHSPPRVAVFHSRKISTNSELPPTSTVTCTSFTLLSLFSRTFFFSRLLSPCSLDCSC